MFTSLASWCLLIKIHSYVHILSTHLLSLFAFFFSCRWCPRPAVPVQEHVSPEHKLVSSSHARWQPSLMDCKLSSVGSGSVRTPLIRTTRQRSASTLRWSASRCSAFRSAYSCKSWWCVDSANCKQENNGCIHTVVSSFVVSSSHLGCFIHSYIKSFIFMGTDSVYYDI